MIFTGWIILSSLDPPGLTNQQSARAALKLSCLNRDRLNWIQLDWSQLNLTEFNYMESQSNNYVKSQSVRRSLASFSCSVGHFQQTRHQPSVFWSKIDTKFWNLSWVIAVLLMTCSQISEKRSRTFKFTKQKSLVYKI